MMGLNAFLLLKVLSFFSRASHAYFFLSQHFGDELGQSINSHKSREELQKSRRDVLAVGSALMASASQQLWLWLSFRLCPRASSLIHLANIY